ncbi:MAG: hypothetical protein ACC628_10585 [Pirellulaceae bacterium]
MGQLERCVCLSVMVGCVFTLGPELGNGQEKSASPETVWEAFQENVRSLATCDLEVHLRASRIDPKFVTNQHRYRRNGDLIRWDQLTRGQRRQGVMSENLAQLFFDGSQTVQITVNLAGLERDFSPLQPRGMRCQVSPGLEQRLNDALILEVLNLRAYAVGESLSFTQVPSSAASAVVVDDTKPTVRYTLPDLKQGNDFYTGRFVEFDFDRARGWWISHARFGATPNTGEPMSGGIRIQEFHDLGNGRFFPKILVGYSHTTDGSEKIGPVTEVTRCRINEPVDEAELVLETPVGLPISTETRREGNLRFNKLRVHSSAGEIKEFQDHDDFVRFTQSVKGQDEWTGSYAPPNDFDYYFKDEQQAKALLQKTLGTQDLSPIRSRRAGDKRGATGAESGAANRTTNSSPYLLWGGLAVLAVVAFFTIQQVSRSRMKKLECSALRSGGNLKS